MELLGENGKRMRALTVSPKWIVRQYRSSGKQVWLVDTGMNHMRLVRLQTSITRSTFFPAGASRHLLLNWQTPGHQVPNTAWLFDVWNRNTNLMNNAPTATHAKFDLWRFIMIWSLVWGGSSTSSLYESLNLWDKTQLKSICFMLLFSLAARTALWGFSHRRTGSRFLWLPNPILAVIARRYAYHGLYS